MVITPFFDKLSFWTLFAVLILMPVVSHAGGLGVAPLVFILGIVGAILAFKTQRFNITNFQIAIGIFLSWLCVTALWSPYKPDDFLTNYLKLFLMVVVFYWSKSLFEYAGGCHKRRHQHLFMAMTFFTASLLVIDLLTNFGLTLLFNPVSNLDEKIFRFMDTEQNLGHSITILILLTAPAVVLMQAELPKYVAYPIIILFLCHVAWSAWLNNLSVGLLGLGGVIAAMLSGYLSPRHTPRILLGFAIISVLFAPFFAFLASNYAASETGNLPLSWDHRLRMWGYCWHVIVDNPLQGLGFDASRTFDETYIARDGREITIVSLHPHNAGIQIWTEAGLVGAGLASGVIATLFKPVQAFAQSRDQAAAVSGVIIAVIIISSLTYGAWQFWWWGCVFFAVGILYFIPKSRDVRVLNHSQWVS